MLIDTNLSREEIFALVWERPATEVARELGVSDVALGKLCRRLQVPKPPRGYWARVASGKKPRRPPLQEYRTEIEKRLRKQARSQMRRRIQLGANVQTGDVLPKVQPGITGLAFSGNRKRSKSPHPLDSVVVRVRVRS